ncbi:MAG: hypothetical protein PHH14_06455 [Candidatus Margulisbacteria bacterium]|nr:hypothetical protein [Candidatus Margulisiibacteriota bacterium]
MLNFLSTSPKDEVVKLLKRRGYQLLGRDQKEVVVTKVNGQDHLGELRAEYTVQKNGKRFVVVIRNEEGDPTEPALRRRLIEYDRVFGLNGILLVNPEEEECQEIVFKFPREKGIDFYFQFIIAMFIVFGVIGILWLMTYIKLF